MLWLTWEILYLVKENHNKVLICKLELLYIREYPRFLRELKIMYLKIPDRNRINKTTKDYKDRLHKLSSTVCQTFSTSTSWTQTYTPGMQAEYYIL